MANKPAGRKAVDPTTRSIIDHWTRVAPDDRLAHLIRDASRGLRRALQFRLSEHDISFGHWAFLRILWIEDGLSQRELSVQAGVTESTTHTALNKMQSLGLITRRHRSGNQRRLHVYLSRSGNALQKKLEPLAEQVNQIAVEGLNESEVEQLRRLMLTIITNLADDEVRQVDRGQRIQSTRSLGRKSSTS